MSILGQSPVFLCTDQSRSVKVIKRHDAAGNLSGGLVLMEGGRHEPAVFKQAVGREFVEELAKVFGGTVTWGLSRCCE